MQPAHTRKKVYNNGALVPKRHSPMLNSFDKLLRAQQFNVDRYPDVSISKKDAERLIRSGVNENIAKMLMEGKFSNVTRYLMMLPECKNVHLFHNGEESMPKLLRQLKEMFPQNGARKQRNNGNGHSQSS